MTENEQDINMLNEMDDWMRVDDETESDQSLFVNTDTGDTYVKTSDRVWAGANTNLMFRPEGLNQPIKVPDPLTSTHNADMSLSNSISVDKGMTDTTVVGTFATTATTAIAAITAGTINNTAIKQRMRQINNDNIDYISELLHKLEKEVSFLESMRSPLKFSVSARQAEKYEFDAVRTQFFINELDAEKIQFTGAMSGNPPYSEEFELMVKGEVEKYDFDHAMDLVR